jgi:hypothetical protein
MLLQIDLLTDDCTLSECDPLWSDSNFQNSWSCAWVTGIQAPNEPAIVSHGHLGSLIHPPPRTPGLRVARVKASSFKCHHRHHQHHQHYCVSPGRRQHDPTVTLATISTSIISLDFSRRYATSLVQFLQLPEEIQPVSTPAGRARRVHT